jgi:hypothetical protein
MQELIRYSLLDPAVNGRWVSKTTEGVSRCGRCRFSDRLALEAGFVLLICCAGSIRQTEREGSVFILCCVRGIAVRRWGGEKVEFCC